MPRAARSSMLLLLLASCVIREQTPATFAPPPTAPGPMTATPAAPLATAPSGAPPAATNHGCDHDYFHYQPVPLATIGPELHLVALYGGAEVEGEHGIEPRQAVHVTVDRPGKEVELVLTAYDPVDWTISLTPGTQLRRAILSGYHLQRAKAPAGTLIETYSYDEQKRFSDAYYAYQWPSVNAEAIVSAAQAYTHLPLASARGCYQSSYFTITEEDPTPPARVDAGFSTRCGKVLSERRSCVAMTSGGEQQLVAIGLDSGDTCVGPVVHVDSDGGGSSALGWFNDHVYQCVRERGVAQISLLDGSIQLAPVPCESVTSDGQSLILTPSLTAFGSSVERYASFDDLRAHKVAAQLPIPGHVSRLAVRGNLGYVSGHSTDEVSIIALDSSKRATIKLDRYDDWIFGLDALSDGTVVIGSPRRTLRDLRLFDGASGKQLRSYSLQLARPADIAGFKCQDGGAP